MHPTLLQYIPASIDLIFSTRQQDVESSLFGERQLPLYKTLNPLLLKVKLTNFLFVKKNTSSMPVLALSYFEPSDALLADPDITRAPLQIVVRAEGCLGYVTAACFPGLNLSMTPLLTCSNI